MKFLVLGASGMAGHVICLYLKEKGHEVVGYSRRKVTFVECISGDAKDTQKLKTVIEDGKFDVVINSIGMLNQIGRAHV